MGKRYILKMHRMLSEDGKDLSERVDVDGLWRTSKISGGAR